MTSSTCMAEDKKQILHGECPRKLNLNMPLLSTRRPFGVAEDQMLMPARSYTISRDATNGVPFSWERVPGVPKDKETTNDNLDNVEVMLPPKPPPGRWRPPLDIETTSSIGHGCDGSSNTDDCGEEHCSNQRHFSDAIDIFSLAESTDDVEFSYRATKGRSSAMVEPNDYDHSPSFIIQRFLPDAQALAEASVIANKNLHLLNSSQSTTASLARAISIRRSYDSPKGCGLGSFFSNWRMRPKHCSVKSPVCDTIVGTKLKHNS